MSTHATSILRGRRLFRSSVRAGSIAVAFALFLFSSWGIVYAQVAPTPPPAVTKTVTTPEDTPVIIDTGISVPAGNWYIVLVTVGPAHGTAVGVDPGFAPPPGSTYKINYTPGANRVDPVSFAYQLCTRPLVPGPQVCGTQATVTVDFTPVNDAPQVGADQVATFKNVAKDIDVLANDYAGPLFPDGTKSEPLQTLTLAAIATQPSHGGTATISGNKVHYVPPTNFCGDFETFTYTVRDNGNPQLVGTGTVEVTVSCGDAVITVGDPYMIDDHMFLVDITLESHVADVSAVDFFVTNANPACLQDPDGATPQLLADNVTNMPPGPSFVSQVADITNLDVDPDSDELRFSIAGIGNPPAILTGPSISTTTRRLATVKFKASGPGCPGLTADLTLRELRNNANTQDRGFTGPNGQNIEGDTLPKTLVLANINQPPTDILLSNNVVQEGIPNAFIGFLSTVDVDAGDTFVYALTDPSGFFRIRFGNELAVRPALGPGNGPPPPSGQYDVDVTTTDSFGAQHTKTFTIYVTNVNQAPTAGDDDAGIVRGRTTIPYVAALNTNDDDPDAAAPHPNGCPGCSIQSVTQGAKGMVTTDGVNVIYTPTDPAFVGANKTDTFTYIVTDNDPSGALSSNPAIVTVNLRRDRPPGDCNDDGAIGAGDLVATALELFDAPLGSNWYDTPLGNYAFSSYGCNSNIDMFVTAGDLACTAQKIFNNDFVCGTTMLASSATVANLAIANGLSAAPGMTVNVPVMLSTAGNAVAAAAFAVDFDAESLSFDATDADGDSLPDAVSLTVPSGAMAIASYNAAESRVEIVVTGMTMPLPLLSDGAIATVTLTVNEGVSVNETAVTLTESSLGGDQGQSVPLEVIDGSIQITTQPANRVLLPLINR